MSFVAPISSEIFLAISAMLLLLAGAYSKDKGDMFVYRTSLLVVGLTIFLLISKFAPVTTANDMFINDVFAVTMKVLALGAVFVVLVMSAEGFDKTSKNPLPFEYPVLVLLASVGMMVMISANNLMSLYMGLELQSLALYVLTAMRRDDAKSTEAGLKYFMLGALSSGILLYGVSLIYGFLGTLSYSEIARYLAQDVEVSIGVIFGMVLVFVGLCFKLSVVPFHMWAPDVYEGAPKNITALFASAPKVAAMALFVRFAITAFGNVADQWQQIIICVSIASMIVGAVGALVQTNIKRLLAYSSIGHMGFALVGLAAGTQAGIQGVVLYTILYVTMSLGVFAFIISMKRRGEDVENISDLAGVAKDRPLFALGLTILMFSMAGIPPMAGFFGKLYVFKAALTQELYALAIIGMLSSVVSAFYYIKIVKVMYFDKPREALDKVTSLEMKLVLTAFVGFNVLYFTFPSGLLKIAENAAASLF